jgi:hypothetical protein
MVNINPADLFKIAHTIETPLMLAGLVVLVLFALFRTKISEARAKQLFVLALVAIILGVVADLIRAFVQPPARYFITGRVFSPPTDSTSGVPRAVVFLAPHNSGVQTTCTDALGYFRFEIDRSWLGNDAELWVVADKYEHSKVSSIALTTDPADQKIGIIPAAPESTSPGAAIQKGCPKPEQPTGTQAVLSTSCLDGDWPEQLVGRPTQPNTLNWHITTRGKTLQLARRDGFVSGTFSKEQNDWKGDLTWGNGDVWHNVLLSPTEDCRTITTNQSWYYSR